MGKEISRPETVLLPAVQCFLALLNDGLHGKNSSEASDLLNRLSDGEFAVIMQLSKLHNLPLVGERIYKTLGAASRCQGLKQDLMQTIAYQANATQRLLMLLRELENEKVPALVVKGAVCRGLYPIPELRPSTDEDVYVEPEYTQAAEEVLNRLGFSRTDEGKANDPVHTWSCGTLRVELHSSLLDEGGIPGKIPTDLFGDAFTRREYIVVEGHRIPTLSHQEHFVYLILHYYKHFLSGGIGVRQICDICLYAQRYEQEINWGQVWKSLEEMGLEVLVWNLRDIGIRYLDMEDTLMPEGPTHLMADSLDLLADTLEAGVFGSSTIERKHSSSMTIRAAKTGKKNAGGVGAALFPTAKSLKGRYPYLEKHTWLLPVAWCSRAFGYLKEGKNVTRRASQAADIGQQRLELLEKYGILDA